MQVLINIDVDDLDRAIEFYRSAFGLTAGRRLGDAGVEMLGSTAPIYLLPKRAGTVACPTAGGLRRYDRHWTPIHLDFVVEDVESAVRQAVDAGARIESAISTHSWGRLALLADPFGHGFCFVQFLGRGYDEMAVAALDIDAGIGDAPRDSR
jgi:predicted enzyme related to lactoylglutathione lyase